MAAPKYAEHQWEHDQFVAAHPYPHTARPNRRGRPSRKVVNHTLTRKRSTPKLINVTLITYSGSGTPDPKGGEKMIMSDHLSMNEATGDRSAADPLGILAATPPGRTEFGA